MVRKSSKMANDLNEVSLAIGELRAGQAANREALFEIRADVKTIITGMSNLPPSPVCVAEHIKINNRIDDNDKKVAWLTAKVGAIIIAGASMTKLGLAKLGIDF